jgi:hypothetical protein
MLSVDNLEHLQSESKAEISVEVGTVKTQETADEDGVSVPSSLNFSFCIASSTNSL